MRLYMCVYMNKYFTRKEFSLCLDPPPGLPSPEGVVTGRAGQSFTTLLRPVTAARPAVSLKRVIMADRSGHLNNLNPECGWPVVCPACVQI